MRKYQAIAYIFKLHFNGGSQKTMGINPLQVVSTISTAPHQHQGRIQGGNKSTNFQQQWSLWLQLAFSIFDPPPQFSLTSSNSKEPPSWARSWAIGLLSQGSGLVNRKPCRKTTHVCTSPDRSKSIQLFSSVLAQPAAPCFFQLRRSSKALATTLVGNISNIARCERVSLRMLSLLCLNWWRKIYKSRN